jgi:hypothetical protein
MSALRSRLLLITLLLAVCFENKADTPHSAKDKPASIDAAYEIVRSDNVYIDVFIKDTSELSQVNDKIVADSNSRGDKDMLIMYFDDREAAATFFLARDSEDGSIPHHRVAVYHCIAHYKGELERENWKP